MISELFQQLMKMWKIVLPIKPQERLEIAIRSGLEEIDLEQRLLSSAKEGITLSEKRLGDYTLSPLKTGGNANSGFDDYWSKIGETGNTPYLIYLDAPVGFALLYKGLPNALVGVNCPDKNTVMIRQLQGVISYFINDNHAYKKTSARGLMPLDWQKLMVDCTVNLAKTAQFERIGIEGYIHNRWKNLSSFTSSKAKEKYDGTAERLGFTLKNDQNWYKQL